MKKIWLSVICIIMVFALCACGDSGSGTGGNNPETGGANPETKTDVGNQPTQPAVSFEP